MKITGYRLQHALRELAHARDIAAGQFADSLVAFPGEAKARPADAMVSFQKAEDRIARIQTIQGDYNLRVKVVAAEQRMSLSEAVKRVGGAGRAEKMWRDCASPKKDKYGYDRMERDKDAIVALRTVPVEDAAQSAKEAAKWASALREAIQVGNATEIEFEVEDNLFE